jgi:uncharacterized protein
MTLRTYKDKAGQWRWRLQARNGRVIADSGEGYTRKRDCQKAFLRMIAGARTIRL